PALRERPADIVPLAQFFTDKYAEANGVAKKKLSKEAQDKLASYHWRGNIRELENTMHRAILMSLEDELEADAIHLSDSSFSSGSGAASAPNKAPDPAGVGKASSGETSAPKN